MNRMGWCAATFLLGTLTGANFVTPLYSQNQPAPSIIGANPQAGSLLATLWMRTSADYRAVCLQTYKAAYDAVSRRVVHPDGEAAAKAAPPWAVIMDLDETVLDNSAYQGEMILKAEKFTEESFNKWLREKIADVRLVAGAKGFIDGVRKLGVEIYFITNRPESERAATMETLKLLRIAGDDIDTHLFLKTDVSDKTSRRKLVEEKYRVAAYVGDNLGDFTDEVHPRHFEKMPDPLAARAAAVDAKAERWGRDWFALPNPVYGDWMKPIDFNNPARFLAPNPMSAVQPTPTK